MTRTIMIDLETLGSVPGCAIVAIGAVSATTDGFILDSFYCVVSRESCKAYGLHESAATLDWWTRQSDEARAVLALSEDPAQSLSLPDALARLNDFVWGTGGQVEVYGNGSDFDNAILAAAAHAAHVELLWPFWANRCYRTIKSRYPHVGIVRSGTHHNALDDARSQAEHLGRLNRAMTLSSDTIVAANIFLGFMADRYRQRTARRIFGFRLARMSRETAMQHALATFEANALDSPFGDPRFAWDRADANDMVDEDLQHWEA